MSRNLNGSLAAALTNSLISPVLLAALTFNSGVMYVWTGVGSFVYEGNTYIGVGDLVKVSPVSEGSSVKADGMEVTLNSIGKSPFGNSWVPPGVSNPVSVPMGQFVAWSVPTSYVETVGSFGIVNANAAVPSNNTPAHAFIEKWNSNPLSPGPVDAVIWEGFTVPDLPAGAVVQGIYPVVLSRFENEGDSGINVWLWAGVQGVAGFNSTGIPLGPTGSFNYLVTALGDGPGGTQPIAQYESIVSQGSSLADLPNLLIGAGLADTENASILSIIEVSFVGFAVYYTAPDNVPSLLAEAMDDLQMGAPVEIWFGLMSDGALIGSPYLIFAGQVDQPTTEVSTQGASITLALENKLSNLLRPTARRYTAADQHLQYPDDIGFNWVEMLNDVALRWGT